MKKRVLSCFMALVMMLSLLPMSVLAAGDSISYNDKEAAKNATAVEADKVATGPDKDGNYTVTLSVKGNTETSTGTKNLPADVVLVVDTSTSMDEEVPGKHVCGGTISYYQGGFLGYGKGYYCNSCEEYYGRSEPSSLVCQEEIDNNRLYVAKSAAKEFASGLMEASDQVRIGLYDFSGSNRTNVALTNDKTTILSGIDGLNMPRYGDGTSYNLGLTGAKNILAQSDSSRQKFVVFISDGEPNNGKYGTTQANELKNAGVTIMTVGVDMDSLYYLKAISSKDTDGEYYCFSASTSGSGNALSSILEKIQEEIESTIYSGTNGVVTDMINTDDFDVVGWTNTEKATINGNTLTWNVGNIGSEKQTLSFTVRPKAGKYGKLHTNTDVTLKFYSTKQQKNVVFTKEAIGDPTVNVPVPTCDVIYNGNAQSGGTVTNLPENSTGQMGTTVKLSKKVPNHSDVENTKVVFIGWTKAPTAEIYDKDDTAPETITSVDVKNENITVYAAWGYDTNGNNVPDVTETKYTVTYTDGVEDEEIFKDEVHSGLLKGTDTPAFNNGTPPARDGYDFTGWKPGIAPKVTGDATYTAQWKEKEPVTYQVTVGYQISSDGTAFETTNDPTTDQSNPFTVKVGESWTVVVGEDAAEYNYKAPQSFEVDDKNYVFDKVATTDALNGNQAATVTLKYGLDADKDGIPDYYQTTVTFKVENGKWNDTGKYPDNTITKVVTLMKDGKWAVNGTYTLTADDIPAVGDKPDAGYTAGNWVDQTPEANKQYNKDQTTFTYRYKAVPIVTLNKELLEVDGKPYTSGAVTSGQVLTYQITVKNAGKADARGPFNVTDSMWRDRTITDYKVMVKDTNGFNDYTQAYPMNGGTVVMHAIAVESEYVFTYKYTVQQSDEGKSLDNKVTLSISGQEWIDEVTVDVVKSTCTIKYSYESGTKDKDLPENFLTPPGPQTVKVGDEIQLPSPENTTVQTEDGVWEFRSWRSEQGDHLNPPIIARGDMKIVGLWFFKEATYTLTYDANDGDTNSVPTDSNKYTKGAEVELNTDKVPTHADVDNTKVAFIGWSTEQVDKIFGAGEDYTDTTAMVTINENTIVYAVWGYDRNGDEIADATQVVIAPADITIYTGGEHSYDGVVDENGNIVTDSDTSGFPDPGFTVTLPYDLKRNPEDLSLQFEQDGKILKWSFVKYSDGDHNVYRIEPADGTGTRPVRMQFTNHSTGDTFTSDTFEIDRNLNQTLDMEVYGDGIEAGDVFVPVDGGRYTVATAVASLTVRGTTDHPDYGKLNKEIVEDHPGLTANEGTTFTINDSEVEVKEDAQIALLFDDIIENNDVAGTNTDLLEARADKVLKSDDYEYEFKYLDLVDTNNGNTWVAADQDVTVSWPLPEGTDKNTKFTVLHFEGLHREMGTDTIPNLIDTCKVETVKIVDVSDTHVTFKIGSAGFSPFALAWDNGNEGGGGGGGDKPPVLDKENHYGYIVGYTDDTVRPNGDITRAEVATIFFRLLTDESRDQYWSQTNDFSDVAADQWYNNAISTLTNAGILDGYEDGTFRPNGNITRAEFATIAVRFFDLTYEGEDLFPDIANHWAREYINQAASAGFVNGYEDGTFRPDNPITRAEAVTMVNRTLERKPHKAHMLDDMKMWSDNMDKTVWYYEAIQEATNSHEYYMEKNDQNVEYEVWTKILPMRDWPALEKEWSQSNGGN